MTNTEDVPRTVNVELTRLWLVFAAILFIVQAVVASSVDVLVLDGVDLMGTPMFKWPLVALMLAVSAFLGGFAEYSRVRMNMLREQATGHE